MHRSFLVGPVCAITKTGCVDEGEKTVTVEGRKGSKSFENLLLLVVMAIITVAVFFMVNHLRNPELLRYDSDKTPTYAKGIEIRKEDLAFEDCISRRFSIQLDTALI